MAIGGRNDDRGPVAQVPLEQLEQEAEAAFEAGNFAEAEEIWRRILQLNPDDAYAHYRLAYFLSWYGRYEEAEPLYRLAIQLNPSDFRPYSELGQRLQVDNRYEEAETL